MLNVILNFLFKLFCRFGALYKHYACLYHLTANLVGRGGNAAFKHIGQLHYYAFYLERPYAVARRLDNVVHSAHIPVKAVLITPRGIARVVVAVVPYLVGLFLILIISRKQSARYFIGRFNHNFACFAVGYGVAVGIQYIHVISRRRLAH